MKKKLGVPVLFLLGCLSISSAAQNITVAHRDYLEALIEESRGNLSGAELRIRQAIQKSPDIAPLYQTLADYLYRQNKLQEAAEKIELALTLDPKNYKSEMLAGQIYWALKDVDKAEEKFKAAVALAPDEATPLVSLAAAVGLKDPKKGVKLYEEFLSRHPSHPELHERLGQIYNAEGNTLKAKECWNNVLSLSPDSVRAHLAMAQISELEHSTAAAISHYEAVLESDPTNLPLLLRVGELRYRSDDVEKAQEAFEKAQAVSPTSASANFWLALVKEREGKWDEAIVLLKKVSDKTPEAGVLLRLAFCYSQIGKDKEAIDTLEQLSRTEPENTDFLNYLVLAYEKTGDFARAKVCISRLIDIDPLNSDYRFQLGCMYDQLKKFSLAEIALQDAIRLDPENDVALNYLAYTYAERNIKLDQAENFSTRALLKRPNSSAYLDSRGWVSYKQGKYDQALEFVLKATTLGRDTLLYEHLGDIYRAQGKFVEAYGAYDEALALKPHQSLLEKKWKDVFSKIPVNQKEQVLWDQINRKISHFVGLSGWANIGLCQGRACTDVKSQVEYNSSQFSLVVPGPMGIPLVQIEKKSGSEPVMGALDPVFLEIQSTVKEFVSLVTSLLSGDFYKPKDVASWKSKNQNTKIAFSTRNGQLEKITTDAGDSIVSWKGKNQTEIVPDGFVWVNKQSKIKLSLMFLSPKIQFAPFNGVSDEE